MSIWTCIVCYNFLSTLYPVCRRKRVFHLPKESGHVSGQKFVVERGTVPQTMASTTDQKFTMLPFTSASVEAVCCTLIFQRKSQAVPAPWCTGIDYSITPILSANGEEIDVEMNVGKGKYYPGGLSCQYNGKTVDCLIFVLKSGGITGDIRCHGTVPSFS